MTHLFSLDWLFNVSAILFLTLFKEIISVYLLVSVFSLRIGKITSSEAAEVSPRSL